MVSFCQLFGLSKVCTKNQPTNQLAAVGFCEKSLQKLAAEIQLDSITKNGKNYDVINSHHLNLFFDTNKNLVGH